MNKNILVIDDSATIRASAEFALTEAGFNVKTANNGVDALDKLNIIKGMGENVLLIICDINMPEMDGITFIKEVKKTQFKFIPVLVMTTETQESKKMEGKSAGAAGWLTKPFDPEKLIGVVRKFVR